ncbi:MAG: hypothetical protein COC09_02785 [Gammaproteobacteria bacterium]|nr:GGDEF domain-containing protein [Gammaproteobacteria bacterium]PCH64347.1 MAG: hypothetical protein COC09_02785 [Gammaproteobacteria bacterium]
MSKVILAKDFMSSPVTTVNISASLIDIVKVMSARKISCLLVLKNGLPVGMITERDIVTFLASHLPKPTDHTTAKELMTSPLITINENDSLFAATVLCRSQKVRHVPILENNGTLAGIITYSDLVEANHLQLERQAALFGKKNGSNIMELNEHLIELTLTDPLMEIGNRRSMEMDLQQTQQLSKRYKRPFSLIIIDIDFFKLFNDHYGHYAGDECLKHFAYVLKQCIRDVDRLYRYGGEEILVLLPETTPDNAIILARRIISSIYEDYYEHIKSSFEFLTASAGVSGYDASKDAVLPSPGELIIQADNAMYEAKRQGRNCARLYEGGETQATL